MPPARLPRKSEDWAISLWVAQEPSAGIATTHDVLWMTLVEAGRLSTIEDLERRVEELVTEHYSINVENGTVYLNDKESTEQDHGSLTDLLFDRSCLPANGPPESVTQVEETSVIEGGLAEVLPRVLCSPDKTIKVGKFISMKEEAVRLTLDAFFNKPSLLNKFGISLARRFERESDPTDITSWLNDLGISLSSWPEWVGGDLADINESISIFGEAVGLTPDGHPDKPCLLNNLGNALLRRFERLGDLADINKSISVLEEAVCLTPDGHPDKPSFLNNLGNSFIAHSQHSSHPSSLSAATLHFSLAARSTTDPTFTRFPASCSWVSSVRLQGNPQALLDAYTTTINLLPELPWIGLSLAEHDHLFLAADIARDAAAAAAIEAGFPEMGVEWLEQGRSVTWSQILQLRTPVDELHVEYPALADQLNHISQELREASSLGNSTSYWLATDSGPATLSLEQETQRHHELAISRKKLLADIRSLPGFDRFLLPKTIQQLATSAHSGPVVYLNASSERWDALIIKEDLSNVLHVPLPGISYLRVEVLRELLHHLLIQNCLVVSPNNVPALPPFDDLTLQDLVNMLTRDGIEPIDRAVKPKPQRVAGQTPDELFRLVLADLWRNVVKPVLGALGFSTPPSTDEKKTRIFLSSYIPTLSALAPSSQKGTSNASSNIRIVAVPQPPTDGLTRLTSMPQEITHIKTLSASSPFVTFQDSQGTVKDVLEKMESNSDWVHFACHGVQDPGNPLDSGLCLADGHRLKLSDIIRLSRPHRGLAFLSACQTARGKRKLSEEPVHLAAGMLFAGYSGVISTMWSIRDPDAATVTKDVYEHLFRDGKVPDSTEAAEALHYAVQHLRDSGASFFSWARFMHVGI